MDALQQKSNNKPKEIINQDEILCDNKKWTTLTFNNESQIEVYSHIREPPWDQLIKETIQAIEWRLKNLVAVM